MKDLTQPSVDNLQHLPAFAQYLLQNRLNDMAQLQLKTAQELKIPLLRFLQNISDTERVALARHHLQELLTCLAQNKARQQIENALQLWKQNQLPIPQQSIALEDITQFNYLRKQSFLQFLPDFTKDISEALEIVRELDRFVLESNNTSTHYFTTLLSERIESQNHFIQKIADTTPGIICVFDIINNKEIYANKASHNFLGMSLNELVEKGASLTESIVHPNDVALVQQHQKEFDTIKDGEIKSVRYRVKNAAGAYRWVRSFETVFKRNEDGRVAEKIGIIIDVHEQKLLSDALRKREAELSEAQEIAQIGTFTWDLKDQASEGSAKTSEILEVEYNNFPAFFSKVHPSDQERLQHAIDRALQTGVLDCYFKYQGAAAQKHIWSRGIVHYENGTPSFVRGTVMDVTERQMLIEDLQKSEHLFKQAQSLAHLGNWSLRLDDMQLFCSEELCKIYELPADTQWTMDLWESYIHPQEKEEVLAHLNHCIKTGTPYNKIQRIVMPDGRIKTLHRQAELLKDSSGNVLQLVGTTQDITEQQRLQQALNDNENFIKKITDASPTIQYLFDTEKQSIIYINREIFFALGYAPEEIIETGNNLVQLLVHPDDVSLLPERTNSNKTFKQLNAIEQYECRLKSKSGEWRWFLVREIVFKENGNGGVAQLLGAALDITHRKEMESTILQNTVMLKQSNASLEEFAYVASHDLKEPLRKIATFGDRLHNSQQQNLTEDGKVYLKKIIDASQRMQTMISDLLSISMIAGNRQFERYSINQILDETLQFLDHKIEQSGAVVQYQLLPEANIIPAQFRQLFQNLISNSLKFTQPGVQPLITIAHDWLTPADVGALPVAKAAQYLKITFEDNGIGFENEFAAKIFAIFQRLHGRTEYEGSGIGLAICKKIAEHHGGVIYASGTPGQGSVFTIVLPV